MKICVFGAGAIGGLIAARLARVKGVDVSVVARGATLDAIRRNGLQIVDCTSCERVAVAVTGDPRELGVQDYVFVTVKSQQFTPSLGGIAELIGPETVVIPPTTTIPFWYFHELSGPHRDRHLETIDPGQAQWNAIGPTRVLGCVFRVAAESPGPGVVRQTGSYARLPIGEPDGTRSIRAARLSEVMSRAGFESPVVSDIRSWIWHKMISSLCWNPLAVLTMATWGTLARDPSVHLLARRMMDEADAVASALGGTVPLSIEERMSAPLSAPNHKMSMLQDLENGRPLEYAPILESFTSMRDVAQIVTPTIDEVYALLKLRAASTTG
ncbi:2-dehydropantoate 2-reductase [Variovorax sp. Root411]|uniref:2-dehydropantoate 2-reductase n=1 Tax=Variovorax sp. Root411 TaxID=1736530 RepID=UPI0006FD2DEC|nr:2-dehydropantoate 2-reductase [Variovorax sp. Root411]KQW54565.1 2-dehydropantoate 2-reductase [Variovorax sp. Root411]